MEGRSVIWLLTYCPELIPYLGHDAKFLNQLRGIHDEYTPIFWRATLQDFAHKYNLVMPSIEN